MPRRLPADNTKVIRLTPFGIKRKLKAESPPLRAYGLDGPPQGYGLGVFCFVPTWRRDASGPYGPEILAEVLPGPPTKKPMPERIVQ